MSLTPPGLSHAEIREFAGREIFARGQDYHRRGAVLSLVRRGEDLIAEVEGSDPTPYEVHLRLDKDGVTEPSCTCPYEWGDWCKHMVAVLLAYLDEPATVEERPTIEALLANLTPSEVHDLFVKLVTARPELVVTVERLVGDLRDSAAPKEPEARSSPRAPLDVAAVRREVRAARRGASRGGAGWDDAWGSGEIDAIVARSRRFLESRDVASALAMLMQISEETIRDEDLLYDDNGYATDWFAGLGAAWTEAVLSADLTADEREGWVERFDEWTDQLSDYGLEETFVQAREAVEEGWDDPLLQRVLAGEQVQPRADVDDADDVSPSGLGWSYVSPFETETVAKARLRVLDRQERHDAYLNLAAYEGLAERRATMLARLGRLDEAVAESLSNVRTTTDALSLATALHEQGAVPEALRVAEHGLALRGQVQALSTWLRDLAADVGETDRSLRAAIVAFDADPTLINYLRTQELAGDRWPEHREALLTKIRGRRTYALHGPVEVLLHEGLVADAIALVDGSYDYTILAIVADAAIHSHPDWVIRTSKRQAEEIMDAGKSDRYHHAATWLERARRAYAGADRMIEWSPYIEGLIATHQRKYKLRPLLERLR